MMRVRRSRSAIFAHAADLWAAMRAEYGVLAEAEYAAAVEATHGNLVNARGRARRITSWDVFHGGAAMHRAYATDELREHLARHPRTSLAAYEREWHAMHLLGTEVPAR